MKNAESVCRARRRFILWLVLLATTLAMRQPVAAQLAGEGILRGRVVNGTAGGGSTENLPVTLYIFQRDVEKEPLSASTDVQGVFRFEGLPVGSEWAYFARVAYRGVLYSQGPFSFAPDAKDLFIEIPVYETTDDDRDIQVERAHLLLSLSDAALRVVELHVFSNLGDRTYIGREQVQGRRATARFLLPPGSKNLAFDDGALGGRFLEIQGGFVDTEPQWPGKTTVLFSYEIPCGDAGCDLVKEVTHHTTNLNVLIPASAGRVESDRLSAEGVLEGQGQSFLNYLGRNLAPGEQLTLHIVRLVASAESAPKGRHVLVPVLIILGILATALALGYPFWARGAAQRKVNTGEGS